MKKEPRSHRKFDADRPVSQAGLQDGNRKIRTRNKFDRGSDLLVAALKPPRRGAASNCSCHGWQLLPDSFHATLCLSGIVGSLINSMY